MELMVLPVKNKAPMDESSASGIEVATINVLRQEPKIASMNMAVKPIAVIVSWKTSSILSCTNFD